VLAKRYRAKVVDDTRAMYDVPRVCPWYIASSKVFQPTMLETALL
jgi:hypothetical protein